MRDRAYTPIPETSWGREATDKLYSRFHAMKSKANTRGVPFAWDSFSTFLEDLKERVPEGYHPLTHTLRFSLERGNGYTAETMSFNRPREAEVKAREENFEEKVRLAAQLTTLVLTEEGDLSALAEKAKLIIIGEDNV